MPPSTTATKPGGVYRAARQGAGISIRRLAADAGINHTTISRWERGQRDISEAAYQHLTTALADLMATRRAS